MPPQQVLIASDEQEFHDEVSGWLRADGHEVRSARDLEAVLADLQAGAPDLLVAEMRPPASHGFALLEAARRLRPTLPVIVASRRPAVAEAVRAMQMGADSYVTRGDGADLRRAVRSVVERIGSRHGSPIAGRSHPPRGLVGQSPVMRRLLDQIALVGPTRTTVLLTGETGTGKERLAEAVHAASPRRSGPFVAVNCAALTETLLESELFGHERGAFSGALTRREGRFKLADEGTLFLDEIGEITPAIQVKLLRVLQQRQFERVGGNETLSVDVRIIAATNRDLPSMLAKKTFRADLYYRLNVMAIEVPPLRARKGDLPLLIEHIVPRLALELGVPESTLSPEAMSLMTAYDWPGNVRELENVLERALVLTRGQPIEAAVLSPQLSAAASATTRGASTWPGEAPAVPGATFAEIERHAIMTTYESCGRSPRRTAEILGLSPRTVHYRLREYRGETGRRLHSFALGRVDGGESDRPPGGAPDGA
jgi:two-component system NtrC family response regulator/two-component system response regulator HydG